MTFKTLKGVNQILSKNRRKKKKTFCDIGYSKCHCLSLCMKCMSVILLILKEQPNRFSSLQWWLCSALQTILVYWFVNLVDHREYWTRARRSTSRRNTSMTCVLNIHERHISPAGRSFASEPLLSQFQFYFTQIIRFFLKHLHVVSKKVISYLLSRSLRIYKNSKICFLFTFTF